MPPKQIAFLACVIISQVGGTAAMLGMTFVFAEAGAEAGRSGAAVSVFIAVMFVSGAFALPYTESLTRRFGTMRSFVIIQVGLMAVFFAYSIAIVCGVSAAGLLFVGAPAVGVLTGLTQPLMQLVVRAYASPGGLLQAVGFFQTATGLAAAVGGVSAGLLIDEFGPTWCLVINAVSFLPIAVFGLLVKPVVPVADPKLTERPWRAAVQALRDRRVLRITCLIALISAVTFGPVTHMAIPLSRSFGYPLAQHAGLVLGVMAIGGMLPPVVIKLLNGRGRSGLHTSTLFYAACGCLLALLSLVTLLLPGEGSELELALVVLGCFSLCNITAGVYIVVSTEQSSSNEHRGRDLSTYFMAVSLGIPAGALLWGRLVDNRGATPTVLIIGFVTTIAMMFLARTTAHMPLRTVR